MKKPKAIEAKIASILAIANEDQVLSEMRKYAESLDVEESKYAFEYAEDFLAKRRAALEEAFREVRS